MNVQEIYFYIIFSSYFLNVYREGFVTWDPMRIKASWVDLEKEKSYFWKVYKKTKFQTHDKFESNK